jgi:hypothetical protein
MVKSLVVELSVIQANGHMKMNEQSSATFLPAKFFCRVAWRRAGEKCGSCEDQIILGLQFRIDEAV